jgi:HEAT repeat protein
VEACASCHRNHGTPYQWALAPTGKLDDRTCVDCHMSRTRRPVAVGEEPRRVRTHLFPGSRSRSQLERAYRYEAEIQGNEVVVRITNKGAGHHFPTELKQRSLESLVVVKDSAGQPVSRSRMVFRDPYKRPYGLTLPVNTQIPPGQTREHRVPLKVAAGTVRTELHFKLYYPIEDHHPELARQLEARQFEFADVTPSDLPVESEPEVQVTTPESVSPETASPANLVDFARPPIGTVGVSIPEGDDPETIQKLVQLFQFPVPEANGRARQRLASIGVPAVPALIEALGSWDNKTWNQAMAVLVEIGEPALPAVLEATGSDQLYIRYHARRLLHQMGWLGRNEAAVARLEQALESSQALDRMSAAEALGNLKLRQARPALRPLLSDTDPDVVRAAALALAKLGDTEAIPALEQALSRAAFFETRRDLAQALALLGSPAGMPALLAGLDHPDDLLRESAFEKFFEVTAVHLGYDPLDSRPLRLAALARVQNWWAQEGSSDVLVKPYRPRPGADHRAWKLVESLGGGSEPGADEDAMEALVALGRDALPALVRGLKFPPGFAEKRTRILEALGLIGDPAAAPAVAHALQDPVLAVAAWACWALERIDDPETVPALTRYHDRLRTLIAHGAVPPALGHPDSLLAQAARTRLLQGDDRARQELRTLLFSSDPKAVDLARETLEQTDAETDH